MVLGKLYFHVIVSLFAFDEAWRVNRRASQEGKSRFLAVFAG
jgi:hypothetical protein